MKYIKTFEKIKYQIGDFIYSPDPHKQYYPILKILGKENNTGLLVKGYKIEKNKFYHKYVEVQYVLRKATEEEIQDFNIKMDSIKYNL